MQVFIMLVVRPGWRYDLDPPVQGVLQGVELLFSSILMYTVVPHRVKVSSLSKGMI